ncbi:uncharacterized protein JCM15063_000108 [Sporobolomyces koalae]|uniref:uncharacterized protein n=1 Tax=Sporobolomyces koalae TaxID=500713 RepID=UPI00317AB637
MGIPSPAYYDDLFLTKCKLLLQAALNNPKRRGGPTSFEEFAVGLDDKDENTVRMFEILVQETAVRRPRKVPAVPIASTSNTGRRARPTQQQHASLSTSARDSADLDASDETVQASQPRRFPMPPVIHTRIREARPRPVQLEGPNRVVLTAAFSPGSRDIRLDSGTTALATTASSEPTESNTRAEDVVPTYNPSDRLRDMEQRSLFGFEGPEPSFSELLTSVSAAAVASVRSYSSDMMPMDAQAPPALSNSVVDPLFPSNRRNVPALLPDPPTYYELWVAICGEPDTPFPADTIDSFDTLRLRLMASSILREPGELIARDANELLIELLIRDTNILDRLREVYARRLAIIDSEQTRDREEHRYRQDLEQRQFGAALTRAEVQRRYDQFPIIRHVDQRPGSRISEDEDDSDETSSPLMEGIWRAGFVEHVGDGGDEFGTEEPWAPRQSFSAFARRRRALTREREGEGTTETTITTQVPDDTATSASVDTPDTSHAASPLPSSSTATACPVHPPRPLTSADRAMAALRQQREIAPLPSTSTSGIDYSELPVWQSML